MATAPAGRDGAGEAGREQKLPHFGEDGFERFWHDSHSGTNGPDGARLVLSADPTVARLAFQC
ncbi:hypothetical protein Aut01nite_07700 [Actinoplanes utahensis]|nr:hypothetical protein Aut01nite_07700 [Actinoplanes utahensis]